MGAINDLNAKKNSFIDILNAAAPPLGAPPSAPPTGGYQSPPTPPQPAPPPGPPQEPAPSMFRQFIDKMRGSNAGTPGIRLASTEAPQAAPTRLSDTPQGGSGQWIRSQAGFDLVSPSVAANANTPSVAPGPITGAAMKMPAPAEQPGVLARAFPNTAAVISGANEAEENALKIGGRPAYFGQVARDVPVHLMGLGADAMRGIGKILDPAANALKTLVTGDPTPIGTAVPVPVAQSSTGKAASPAAVASLPTAPAKAPTAAAKPTASAPRTRAAAAPAPLSAADLSALGESTAFLAASPIASVAMGGLQELNGRTGYQVAYKDGSTGVFSAHELPEEAQQWMAHQQRSSRLIPAEPVQIIAPQGGQFVDSGVVTSEVQKSGGKGEKGEKTTHTQEKTWVPGPLGSTWQVPDGKGGYIATPIPDANYRTGGAQQYLKKYAEAQEAALNPLAAKAASDKEVAGIQAGAHIQAANIAAKAHPWTVVPQGQSVVPDPDIPGASKVITNPPEILNQMTGERISTAPAKQQLKITKAQQKALMDAKKWTPEQVKAYANSVNAVME